MIEGDIATEIGGKNMKTEGREREQNRQKKRILGRGHNAIEKENRERKFGSVGEERKLKHTRGGDASWIY